jgi:TfoX/Sxy family transcriptional regulator of competence genes
MKKFRPESWQAQARKRGNMLYYRLIDGILDNESQIMKWFALGYNFDMGKQRRKYVEQRAAKRVGRKLRKIQKINEKIICGGY